MSETSWRFTKLKSLALISSVFDPLGFLSLLGIGEKIFMQTLWKERMSWDQTLNQDQMKTIKEILYIGIPASQ